jgi:hypothetical protein
LAERVFEALHDLLRLLVASVRLLGDVVEVLEALGFLVGQREVGDLLVHARLDLVADRNPVDLERVDDLVGELLGGRSRRTAASEHGH